VFPEEEDDDPKKVSNIFNLAKDHQEEDSNKLVKKDEIVLIAKRALL